VSFSAGVHIGKQLMHISNLIKSHTSAGALCFDLEAKTDCESSSTCFFLEGKKIAN
jgi:hypothetical protein